MANKKAFVKIGLFRTLMLATHMAQRTARPIDSGNPSEIAIGVFEDGNELHSEVFREPVPDGFPPEHAHHLADFMVRGFNAAANSQTEQLVSLAEFAEPFRGRRIDEAVQEEGQQAAQLRTQNQRLSWLQIALRLCRHKSNKQHRCNQKCANRIRLAAKPYLKTRTSR